MSELFNSLHNSEVSPVFLITFADAGHPVYQSVMKFSVNVSAGHGYLDSPDRENSPFLR